MNDLGVITSDIRIRRKVHNPANFPALRNQSRASGGFTHVPPVVAKAAPEPAPEAVEVIESTPRYGLQSGARPANLLAFLHDLAEHGRSLPGPAEIAHVVGYSAIDASKYSHRLNVAVAALVKVGALASWVGEVRGCQVRLRAFRLTDGRVVASPGTPEGVV